MQNNRIKLMFTSIIIIEILVMVNCVFSKNENDEWLIKPGISVGRITKNSTETDLIKFFGKENVVRGKIPIGEGQSIDGTIIYKGTNDQLYVIWKNSFTPPINRIIIRKKNTKWKTNDGITIGSSLNDLIKLNGKDFTISGFEWDYPGTIITWNNGKLEENYKIGKKFAANFVPTNTAMVKGYETVLGNKGRTTDNQIFKSLNLKIESMAIIFE